MLKETKYNFWMGNYQQVDFNFLSLLYIMSKNFLFNDKLKDYSNFTNLMLIDEHVTDREIFYK